MANPKRLNKKKSLHFPQAQIQKIKELYQRTLLMNTNLRIIISFNAKIISKQKLQSKIQIILQQKKKMKKNKQMKQKKQKKQKKQRKENKKKNK